LANPTRGVFQVAATRKSVNFSLLAVLIDPNLSRNSIRIE
jgi:hypothetical protein